MLLEAGRRALPEVADKVDQINAQASQFNAIAATLRNDIKAAAPDVVAPTVKVVA